MRQIPYANAAAPLRFNFPVEWSAADVTDVSLTVRDHAANVLTAAANITLYTATKLDGDVDRFASSFALDAAAGDLVPGDRIHIAGVVGAEIHTVKAYNATTFTVEIEGILENEHTDDDVVIGLFGDTTLDVSGTTVYAAGEALVFLWTPAGSNDSAITELAQIAVSALDISGLRRRFSLIYPRAYDAFTVPVERVAEMTEEAERQVRAELLAQNLDIERMVDSEIAAPCIMAKMAYLWLLNGDVDKEDERKVISHEYDRQFTVLTALPLWIDSDQDGSEDDDETSSRTPIFTKGW